MTTTGASHRHTDTNTQRSLLILYATETGNALDAAEQVAREAYRQRYHVRLISTGDYPLADLIHETLVIFVVSTTGTGVEPRSMTHMWKALLRSDLPPDLIEGMDFAVFGLGDTAYENFCWAAKKLSRRLESLGATEICPRGEGDDQHPLGVEGALEPWITALFGALDELYPLPPDRQVLSVETLPPARISVSEVGSSIDLTSLRESLEDSPSYYHARVKCNDRSTALDWYQDVRHIELEFDEDIQYDPGDVAVIHPIASTDDVESFLQCMGWAAIADQTFHFTSIPHTLPIPTHIPRTTTLRTLFTHHLDVNAVPRRSFFKLLRLFVHDDLEREKLTDFCSVEGADDLYEYCFLVRRTIREVMSEFRSARIPQEYIFDLFPPLRPREFSIASSVKVYPRQVHLCVAIVRYKTKLKALRRGVCTTYLASLQSGDILRLGLQKALTPLPDDPSVPVICVGPGTGVAPMRALLGERMQSGSKENTLYFGCRSASKDHHYAAEWDSAVSSGHLIYRTAFSRDGPEGVKRTYVQDLIEQDRERIWGLIHSRHAWIFISGSSNKMPMAVRGAIEVASMTVGGKTEDEAKEYMKALQRDGRLIEECWS